jgi:Na+-transporting NADH:ubiquinone oxidoreductase subunit A
MITVKVPKGCKINIAGKPSLDEETLAPPASVGMLPEKIPFVKPRLKVKVGDRVKIGTPLFEDKRRPSIQFGSPGGGVVDAINFGQRRIIKEIVIRLDDHEEYVQFTPMTTQDIEGATRDDLIEAMQKGGIWPFIKALPFRDIANPEEPAPGIFVNLGASEPFLPQPQVYLKNAINLFENGINILRKLAPHVYVTRPPNKVSGTDALNHLITHTCRGTYPVDDPGVQLYHSKTSSDQNRSWYIDGQDLLHLARFFETGRYPIERIMVLGGTLAHTNKHFKTRTGVPLAVLGRYSKEKTTGARFIAGGLFRGYTGNANSYMGLYENSLNLIPEGDEKEFFGFMRPGYGKASSSKTFLSVFNRSDLKTDCGLHGERRACINCGYCTDVCPVNILPQFTYKCIHADEVEESLAHGLLDCVECGLCTYVCPSKIELCARFKLAREAYYKELI